MTYRNALLLGLSAVALQGCIAAAAIPIVAGSGALVRNSVSDDARSGSRAPEYASAADPAAAQPVTAPPAARPTPAPTLAPAAAPTLAAAEPEPPVAATPPATTAAVARPAADPPAALVTFDEPEFTPERTAARASEPVVVMTLQEPRFAARAQPPVSSSPEPVADTPATAPAASAADLVAFELPASTAASAPPPAPVEPEPEPAAAAAPARSSFAEVGLPAEPPASAPAATVPVTSPAPPALAAADMASEPATTAPAATSREAEDAAAVAAMTRPVRPTGGPIVPGQQQPVQTPVARPAPSGPPAAIAPPAAPPAVATSTATATQADDPYGVGYAALRSYALRALGGGVPLPSAQLANPTSLQPLRRECSANSPVVIFDLDPAGTVVPLVGPLAVNTDLARVLQDLRSRGVNIAWLTDRTAIDARAVRDRLVASGLDPRSEDSIYVERYPGETKQARRDAIAQTQCVIALAGDERADFDDLYNFIIDRNDARALEPMLGSGWFLIANPVAEN